jgi:cell division protein FtsB
MLHKRLLQDRKTIQIAVAAIIVLILLWVVFSSDSGIVRYFQADKEREAVQTANQDLEQKNKQLRSEVDRLEHDPAAIEEVARKQFGLIRKNEIIYDFSKKK